MITLVEKDIFSKNRLLLYIFNSQDLKMSEKKQVRNINAGVKINESDDDFLKKVSKLNGDPKYMRSKTAYAMMLLGMEATKKAIKEAKGIEISHTIETGEDQLSDVIKIASILKKHGLSLEVKPRNKESKDENQ